MRYACQTAPASLPAGLGTTRPDVNDGGARSGPRPGLLCHLATAAACEATDRRTGCRLDRCRRQRDPTCRPPSRRIASRQANRSDRRISYRLWFVPTQRRLHHRHSAPHGTVRRRYQPTEFPPGAVGTGGAAWTTAAWDWRKARCRPSQPMRVLFPHICSSCGDNGLQGCSPSASRERLEAPLPCRASRVPWLPWLADAGTNCPMPDD